MRKKLPKHLSYDYRLKIDEVPTYQADRLPLKVVMPAILLGLLMAVIGVFELMNGMYDPKHYDYVLDEATRAPLFSHTTVDSAFIFLGICIIISSIVAHIRFKKIFFNGKSFSVDFRGVFGENELFREFLRNYNGVRLRLEFFQFGILNKNKYIIELEHRDPQKTIPLYISTDATGIYQIWHYYAKRLNMPTIVDTDEGTVYKEVSELDKTLNEYLHSNGLISIYEELPHKPKNMLLIKKENRTIIKSKGTTWDIWNLVGFFWIFFYLLILSGAIYNYDKVQRIIGSQTKSVAFFSLAILIGLALIGILFKKDKIVLRDNKIILVHKFFFLSKKEYIEPNRIKDIHVAYNPATERYYLAIITQDNLFAFGRALPKENLQWVRDYIIYSLTR